MWSVWAWLRGNRPRYESTWFVERSVAVALVGLDGVVAVQNTSVSCLIHEFLRTHMC